MERIWLKDYPAGVPADIDPSQWPSLVAMIEQSLGRFSAKDAFIGMGKAITYAELDALSRAFALALQRERLLELHLPRRFVAAFQRLRFGGDARREPGGLLGQHANRAFGFANLRLGGLCPVQRLAVGVLGAREGFALQRQHRVGAPVQLGCERELDAQLFAVALEPRLAGARAQSARRVA